MTTASVLVLNATYEPISHTKLARAVALVLRGEAVIEEALADRILRHKNGEMPWPKVLRLLRYVKISMDYRQAGWSKAGVMKRDAHTCAYCSKTADTVDHILPTSQGGDPRCWLNTVAACRRCNHKKRNRTPRQANMRLLIEPTVPYVTRLRIGGKSYRRK